MCVCVCVLLTAAVGPAVAHRRERSPPRRALTAAEFQRLAVC